MVDFNTPIFINGRFWRSLTTAEAESAKRLGRITMRFETKIPLIADWKNTDLNKIQVESMKAVVFSLMDDPIDYLYADDDDLYFDKEGRVCLR